MYCVSLQLVMPMIVFVQVIFITEYMSSGSLKQFLKRSKRNVKKLALVSWRRWCSQILSALRYVLIFAHNLCPPRPLSITQISANQSCTCIKTQQQCYVATMLFINNASSLKYWWSFEYHNYFDVSNEFKTISGVVIERYNLYIYFYIVNNAFILFIIFSS